MCGICGIYNFDSSPVDRMTLLKMNDAMLSRGPDDGGSMVDGAFGMAMRRLSIIDLEGGHQPISNEDGTLHVVLNGEIYNFIELRKDLIAKGHVFKTSSDTEVLLHLYEEYGTDAIHHLNGMFSFCIWDKVNRRIWLGRDRLGVKPLFYSREKNHFIFASSLHALTVFPQYTKEIDDEAFLLYLTLSYVPTPRSIFKNISKLPPGHWMMVDDKGSIKIHKYWDVTETRSRKLTETDFLGEAEHLLKDSIRLHARSDVPVGCFLSGGIDSSLTTALFCQQSDQPVHTFSVDFEGKEISELGYAKMVADRYQTIHHPHMLSFRDALDNFYEMLPELDEPIADSALIPSFYLSKKAREHGIKVILSGAGGDELFGGYFRHHFHKRDALVGKLSLFSIKFWQLSSCFLGGRAVHYGAQLYDKGISFAINTSGVHLGVLQHLLVSMSLLNGALSLLKLQFSKLKELEALHGFHYARMMTDVQQYLLDNILSLSDKSTMAASVEGRVPLLDHRLLELVFSVLPETNIHANKSKESLKKIAKNYLPHEILVREKAGFNGPVQAWLAGAEKHEILNVLKKTQNPVINRYFNRDALNHILDDPQKLLPACETVFMLFVFDLWYQRNFL